MSETTPLIYSKISAVMAELGPIGKNRKNAGQGYQFRGVDDVYNEINPLLAKHKIFSVPEVLEERSEERQTSKGGLLIYRILKIRYAFYAEDGSSVSCTVIGEGMDSGDKASNKAMSVAHKYAILQVFCIGTDEPKDPENDNHEIKPKETTSQPRQSQPSQPLPPYTGKPADYLVPFGQDKGKKLSEVTIISLQKSVDYWMDRAKKEGKQLTGKPLEFCEMIDRFLGNADPGGARQDGLPPDMFSDIPF